MGLRNYFRNREEAKKAEAAADQLFQALLKTPSGKIEGAQSLDKEDPTARALIALQQKYRGKVTVLFQSKTVVISLTDAARAAMANPIWHLLQAHGYFADPNLKIEDFFQAHERFMRANASTDPEEVKRTAQEKYLADTAIKL